VGAAQEPRGRGAAVRAVSANEGARHGNLNDALRNYRVDPVRAEAVRKELERVALQTSVPSGVRCSALTRLPTGLRCGFRSAQAFPKEAHEAIRAATSLGRPGRALVVRLRDEGRIRDPDARFWSGFITIEGG
jgi:hypothetical protein